MTDWFKINADEACFTATNPRMYDFEIDDSTTGDPAIGITYNGVTGAIEVPVNTKVGKFT